MDSDNQMISNPEIKASLLTIYDKIGMPQTREIGYELFLELILNNLYSSSTITFIISQIGDFIHSLNQSAQEPYIKLLSLIFYNPNNQQDEEDNNGISQTDKSIYYLYLSQVLNIIQIIITDQNKDLFPLISNIYAEIVQNVMPTDISASTRKLNMEEKKAYEIVQGFCIYNMKCEENSNKIVGSLCLTKLVENCPIVLQSQYTKFIWDNINNFINKKNFNAKIELLNCLISLILGTENLFCPYANVTLYKVLDFLTDNDWLKRKLALNVIYTLIFYCKEEILPLKDHIINFLKVLKTDKVKEVREVCLLILQIFSESEQKKEKKPENYSAFSQKYNNEEIKMGNNEKNSINNKKNKTEKNKEKNRNRASEDYNNNNNNDNDNEINTNSFHNSEKKNEKNMEKNKNFNEKEKEKEKDNSRSRTPVGRKKSIGTGEEEGKTNININNKFVNRKEDNTFVNEKMKIRPDPNKSIFRTNPNSAFFNQAKNKKNDIIIMAKGSPMKYNYNNNEMENEKKEKQMQMQTQIINESPNNEQKYLNKTQPISSKNKNNINSNREDIINHNDNNLYENNKKGGEIENKKIKNQNEKYQNDIKTKYKRNKDKQIMNKKKEEKENINKKNENNFGFIDKNKKVDSILINKLLSQMNSLSAKQLSFIDVMENIQTDAQQQIQYLNNKIFSLDSLVDELTSELNELRSQNDN